jgi:hypothetical protein
MTVEIRDRAVAERWLAGGLCLMRLGHPTASELNAASPWLLAALSEMAALPPPGVVTDVGRLLLGGGFELTAAPPLPSSDVRLRAAVRGYEDQILGRLAADPRLEAATDAVAKLPPSLQPAAVALVVAHLVERLHFQAGAAISPGLARRLAARPAEEVLRQGFDTLRESTEIVSQLAEGYEELTRAAHKARALLADTEVFALENLTVLGSLTQRLAIEQVVEVAEELGRTLPRRMKRKRASRGAAPTQLEDESAYPIGGFSSMSNSGSLENLVTSELIYMDETEKEMDLFDMRYVEGELLYYTRDESILVRRRRVLTFVLDADLASVRFKDPGLKWQRLVLVLGLILCAVRRLTEWLSEEGLMFRVVFLRGEAAGPSLAQERALCQLLLSEWAEKGLAEVVDGDALAPVIAQAELDARRAQVDVLLIAARDPGAIAADPRVRTGVLDVGAPAPQLRLGAVDSAKRAGAALWTAWSETILELLQELL